VCDPAVFIKGFCEDEDIIQVDHHDPFGDQVLEDVVHLSSGR